MVHGFHFQKMARSLLSASPRTLATARADIRMKFQLKNGQEAEVTRTQEGDRAGLSQFLDSTPANIFHHMSEISREAGAIDDEMWLAQAPKHDSLLAKVEGRVIGLASLEPEPHPMERQLDHGFLEAHGLTADQVCVSRMRVHPDFRQQGVGMALKRAVAQSAADSGFSGVVSETTSTPVISIVKRLGGHVQEGCMNPWTVLKVPLPENS